VDLPTPPAFTDNEGNADDADNGIIKMGVVQPTAQVVQHLGKDDEFEPINENSEAADNDGSDDEGEVGDYK
jgi:hypothetical protein